MYETCFLVNEAQRFADSNKGAYSKYMLIKSHYQSDL